MNVTWGQIIHPESPIEGGNERCVEVPLAFAMMQVDVPGWVLDAGCAMNGRLPVGGVAQIVHLTQNLESERAHLSEAKRSYVCGDLRDLVIFADHGFDRTVCVSTLEHVGFDNSGYAAPAEHDPDSMLDAVQELCRVTAHELLLTVPFHATPQSCAQWRFLTPVDLGIITRIAEIHGFKPETRYYGRNEKGWFGGGFDPVDASPAHFPGSVNAIAAMRLTR